MAEHDRQHRSAPPQPQEPQYQGGERKAVDACSRQVRRISGRPRPHEWWSVPARRSTVGGTRGRAARADGAVPRKPVAVGPVATGRAGFAGRSCGPPLRGGPAHSRGRPRRTRAAQGRICRRVGRGATPGAEPGPYRHVMAALAQPTELPFGHTDDDIGRLGPLLDGPKEPSPEREDDDEGRALTPGRSLLVAPVQPHALQVPATSVRLQRIVRRALGQIGSRFGQRRQDLRCSDH